jgi:hypothetical protein
MVEPAAHLVDQLFPEAPVRADVSVSAANFQVESVPHLAELRTKHARIQVAEKFSFPPNTGTRGVQGDYFRDRPKAVFLMMG